MSESVFFCGEYVNFSFINIDRLASLTNHGVVCMRTFVHSYKLVVNSGATYRWGCICTNTNVVAILVKKSHAISSQGSLFNNILSAHICVRFSCDQCINQFSSKGMIVILIPIYTFTAMFGGHDETQLLFMADGIYENRHNILKIFEIMGFPMDMDMEIRVTADLKLSSILTGLHGTSARHCCIYCEVFHYLSILK